MTDHTIMVKTSASAPVLMIETNGWREAQLRPIPIASTSLTRADESLAALKANRILATAQTAEDVLRHRASWTADAARFETKKKELETKSTNSIVDKADRAKKKADAIERERRKQELQDRRAFFKELARAEAAALTERQRRQQDELDRFRRLRSASERELQSRQSHGRTKFAGSEELRQQVHRARALDFRYCPAFVE